MQSCRNQQKKKDNLKTETLHEENLTETYDYFFDFFFPFHREHLCEIIKGHEII